MKTTWKTWAAAMIAAVTMFPLGCGSVVEVGGQPSSCPASPPKAGSPCDPSAAGCNYTVGPCAVALSCNPEIGAWQSLTTSCLPAAKECWSAQDGDVCANVGETCGESSGPCAPSFYNTCGEDHHWFSSGSTTGGGDDCCPLNGTCPATMPHEGDDCDACYGPPACSYPSTCGGDYASCGPDAKWHIAYGDCPPPPPPDFCGSQSTQGACEMDAGCRWMTPGCGENPPWVAGCFQNTDCTPGDCAPGGSCQMVTYNPCLDKNCDACGAPAYLCIGGSF